MTNLWQCNITIIFHESLSLGESLKTKITNSIMVLVRFENISEENVDLG